jgi:hypothetical protein
VPKPLSAPEPWATAGNYAPSVYPANYPWGDPHPEAGNATAWSNQPRKTASGLAGYCAQGSTPLAPPSADLENEQRARVAETCRWVVTEGTSLPNETAHIVETDSAGQVSAAIVVIGANTSATTPLTVNSATGAGATLQVNGSDEGGIAIVCTDSGGLSIINNSNTPAIQTLNSGPGGGIQTAGPAVFGGVVTPQAGVNLADQTISGGVGSRVEGETHNPLTLEWQDAGVSIPALDRSSRFNGTGQLTRGSDGIVRSDAPADRGWQATFSTPNAIDTTGAAAQREVQPTEPVWIRVTFDWRHTQAPTAVGTLTTRIQVTGSVSGSGDIFIRTHRIESDFDWQTFSKVYSWTPTDDFPGAVVENWEVRLRAGSSLGIDLELRDIGIELYSHVRV